MLKTIKNVKNDKNVKKRYKALDIKVKYKKKEDFLPQDRKQVYLHNVYSPARIRTEVAGSRVPHD